MQTLIEKRKNAELPLDARATTNKQTQTHTQGKGEEKKKKRKQNSLCWPTRWRSISLAFPHVHCAVHHPLDNLQLRQTMRKKATRHSQRKRKKKRSSSQTNEGFFLHTSLTSSAFTVRRFACARNASRSRPISSVMNSPS